MNLFAQFIGLSLVVHLGVILFRRDRHLDEQGALKKTPPGFVMKYCSLLIVLAVTSFILWGAGFIIARSYTDEHSNARVAAYVLREVREFEFGKTKALPRSTVVASSFIRLPPSAVGGMLLAGADMHELPSPSSQSFGPHRLFAAGMNTLPLLLFLLPAYCALLQRRARFLFNVNHSSLHA